MQTLAAFALCLGMLLLASPEARFRHAWAGLAIGLLASTRPIYLPYAALLSIFLLTEGWTQGGLAGRPLSGDRGTRIVAGLTAPWGQTEFQVNLKLGLTPHARTPHTRTPHARVRLIPGCAASRGSGRRSLPELWRGSPPNDLASRPTRTRRTPTHSHSGQFLTRVHPNPISRFQRHPLRLGPAPHSPHRASAAIGPPRPIVTIGSIPLILILANHSLPTYLVTASASFPRA